MQYANVVPDIKTDLTSQSFTYAIPPELLPKIKVGSLVLIPFGKRKIAGIITKITKTGVKGMQKEIKQIAQIINPEPVINEQHLKLAEWLSKYYFAPLSQCLFEMFPLPPKRKGHGKQKLITAQTPLPPIFAKLYAALAALCNNALAKDKQVIILFSEARWAKIFLPSLAKRFDRVIFYHTELNKTQRYNAWQEIKQGKINIVCGSRLALFAPLSRLGLIIIIDEESNAYKNDRSPRYNAKTVALKLAEISGAKLVLLSPTPSIESHYQYSTKARYKKSNRVYLIRRSLIPLYHPSITLIDMKNELRKGNSSLLSETLQKKLQDVYKAGKKAILFDNRRGAASYIFCRNCGYVLKCPNCDLPLTYHLNTPSLDQLVCHHCSFRTKLISLCPNCQSIDFKFWGLGTQRIEAEIKKMFIKPNILRIDKDLRSSPAFANATEDGRSSVINSEYDFIIGTQKLLSHWFEPVDLVAVASIDNLLNLPDLNSSHRVYSIITRLKSLSLNSFYLQTYHPENFVIRSALQGNWEKFLQDELENRRKLNLPPFTKLIRIICQHKNEEKCKKDIKIAAEKLNSIITRYQSSPPAMLRKAMRADITILGPSPCFYSKIRGKYRFQLIIKVPDKGRGRNIPAPIINFLKTLPRNWLIDVDPVTLL